MTTDKMLIDAAHPEETRVVVLRGNRIEEFDFESAAKKLLRGNIYLAKITRVEPSLQAAFVDYGGNRHGFLAFNEIHPDYYQIPVADREALLREEAEAAEAEARQEAREFGGGGNDHAHDHTHDAAPGGAEEAIETVGDEAGNPEFEEVGGGSVPWDVEEPASGATGAMAERRDDPVLRSAQPMSELIPQVEAAANDGDWQVQPASQDANGEHSHTHDHAGHDHGDHPAMDAAPVHGADGAPVPALDETVEETAARRRRPRRASYKIQEVIKRRQIILVQVVKEERGNKGAALTTYLSLAGRYTVLMPNTARGGGISRKITNAVDRKRLKEITSELEVPQGMGLIVRTAGASRAVAEIKRDHDYLLRLWESVRDLTLKSSAPALVYEEGSLVKRSIRDLYSKEIDEVVVAGKEAYDSAHEFMAMLMPSHAKNVKHYDSTEPLFARYGIERQLNAMYLPQVTLRSGGYIVINQTEALVAIDVNSGKSTREHSIEETALATNLEAADEIARQLRLRDLAGLIVIDFIDMEERRNNRSVERRMKDALRFDRARIQVGRISHFGLMEMSRQRLRTGVLEGSTSQCPHCMGSGLIRSTESVALAVLRGLEDSLMSGQTRHLRATTPIDVALYLLNDKRAYLRDIEGRYGITVQIDADSAMQGANYRIDTMAGAVIAEPARPRHAVQLESAYEAEDEPAEGGVTEIVEAGDDAEDSTGEGADRKRSRRRRRGRKGERGDAPAHANGDHVSNGGKDGRNGSSRHDADEGENAPAGAAIAGSEHSDSNDSAPQAMDERADAENRDDRDGAEDSSDAAGATSVDGEGSSERRGRRRGRRGGRRNKRGDRPVAGAEGSGENGGDSQQQPAVPGAEQPNVVDSAWDREVPQQRRHVRHTEPAAAMEGEARQQQAVVERSERSASQTWEVPDANQRERQASVAEAIRASEPVIAHRHLEAAMAVGSTFQQGLAPAAAGSTPHSDTPSVAEPARVAEPAAALSEPAGQPKRGWWMKRLTGL